jgi:hypothetical protein
MFFLQLKYSRFNIACRLNRLHIISPPNSLLLPDSNPWVPLQYTVSSAAYSLHRRDTHNAPYILHVHYCTRAKHLLPAPHSLALPLALSLFLSLSLSLSLSLARYTKATAVIPSVLPSLSLDSSLDYSLATKCFTHSQL